MIEPVKNKKNKILIIGPSSSGKSTIINNWIQKRLVKEKEICFAYEYSWIKKYTKRIFHFNLLRSHEKYNNTEFTADKELMNVLNLKNLFVYILYADQNIVEDRIIKRKYNENQILGKKQKYETLKRLEISKKSDYKKIYDSLIFFLKEKNIKHIIINTNNYNYKEIRND